MKNTALTVLAVVMAVMLAGCFLLPEEPKLPEIAVVSAYEAEEFKLAEVYRGDISIIQTVSLRYVATREQSLSFSEAGRRYGGIFVEVGDLVKAGDLIASMDTSALDMQIGEIESELAALSRELEYAGLNLELAQNVAKLGGEDKTGEFEQDIDRLSDEIYILELKKQELGLEREQRRLYAEIDGTVTYVKPISADSLTIAGGTVVTISDRNSSIFETLTEYYELLPVGEVAYIMVGSETYAAEVISPESIGYTQSEPDEAGQAKVYFSLLSEADISSGAKGEIELLIDRHEDVLLLPKKTIVTAGGQSMVYYQDDDGLRSIWQVEVGLSTVDTIEITSGLSEGDLVILS